MITTINYDAGFSLHGINGGHLLMASKLWYVCLHIKTDVLAKPFDCSIFWHFPANVNAFVSFMQLLSIVCVTIVITIYCNIRSRIDTNLFLCQQMMIIRFHKCSICSSRDTRSTLVLLIYKFQKPYLQNHNLLLLSYVFRQLRETLFLGQYGFTLTQTQFYGWPNSHQEIHIFRFC